MDNVPPRTTRRRLLQALAVSPAVGLASAARAQDAAQAAGLLTANVCMVQTEVTEGPYYIDPKLVRADITEDLPGVPLDMKIQVVSADCVPIEGARVDIWHCDAAGNYSGFANQGSDTLADTSTKTFLRGTQMTDASGLVTFQTIYPGWYKGRTTHLHYKVFLDTETILTSQIFLPDALSQYIYDTVAEYGGRGSARDTVNTSDSIAQQAGYGAFAAIAEQADRYVAALVVGVAPMARSSTGMTGARPPGPPPGGRGGRSSERNPSDPLLGAALIPGGKT
ncbi:intradiol ring-cleavage dioxygenase [Puniceibacterium sp. IMCC21224]|uniref:intradiol ring-cleavage dioxygenase n=1 Tax=Puniceibacterium sp. IMCC21224 TaxID=1618204 RepID=UPI00064DB114|nr:intradiol ring-cleavage dioxygenase [Puniceibacterium sp. IMCC21224]KMK66355.1 protocatechuate 3,4-dioxygenase beta subunit [Puniceibacterium sp. IMCC21224]